MTEADLAELRLLLNLATAPRERVASECAGKHPYQDRPTASRVLAKRREIKLKAYRCQCCGWWHIGSDNVDRARRLTREGIA